MEQLIAAKVPPDAGSPLIHFKAWPPALRQCELIELTLITTLLSPSRVKSVREG